MRRSTVISAAFTVTCILSASLVTSVAEAAPEFVERGITLPRHDWAFDFGLGIGHNDFGPGHTGAGLNLEGSVAVIQHLEIGLRTGARFGNEGAFTGADQYGRLFDRQTYGTGGDTFANPEFRIRGALVHGEVVELALEGRAVLPFEANTYFGAQFGMPILFHLGHVVRLDTGVFVPVIFFPHDVITDISAPIDVWIQCTPRLWLGPMSGVRFHNNANPNGNRNVDISAGFGLGYQILRNLDFKTMFLMPRINQEAGARYFGVGAGIQVRIE